MVRLWKGFKLGAVGMIIVQAALVGNATAASTFYDNEADWIAAVGGPYGCIPFDEAHLGNPSHWEDVNGRVFPTSTTGLLSPFAITVKTALYFNASLNTLDVNGSGEMDDWWDVEFTDGPQNVYAFAMDVLDNNEDPSDENNESLTVYGLGGNQIGSISGGDPGFVWPGGTHPFIGVVTTEPIGHARFVEGNSIPDNIDLGRICIAVPEPCTLSLLALGGLSMLRKRRS